MEGAPAIYSAVADSGERRPVSRRPWLWIGLVITLCSVPTILHFLGVSFSTARDMLTPAEAAVMSASQLKNAMYHALGGSFVHTLLEWSAFCTAIFTVILAFVHFAVRWDVVTPIIAVSLFWAGCMDAFHTLAADHLLDPSASSEDLIPFTWAICRTFNALIPMFAMGLLLWRGGSKAGGRGQVWFVSAVSTLFGVLAYGIIHLCATTARLPRTIFPDSLITRPWDVVPLGLYVVSAVIVYPLFYRQYRGAFAFAIWLSVLPNIATQLHMAFGSKALFDSDFNVAHSLKIMAYCIPFGGLALDYMRTYRYEREAALRLGTEINQRQAVQEQLAEARLREAQIGSRIQKTLLLGRPPQEAPGLEISAISVPSEQIDGDFYDFLQHQKYLDIVVGDVMGKGVPAALMAAATKAKLMQVLQKYSDDRYRVARPDTIVNALHEEICRELIDLDSFITLVYARFDFETHELYLVDCGHTATIHYHRNSGASSLLKSDQLPLGVDVRQKYTQLTIPVGQGDVVLFYSDGVTEAMNANEELFGQDRLLQIVANGRGHGVNRLIADIRRGVTAFSGKVSQSDDLTCVAVRVDEAAAMWTQQRTFSTSLDSLAEIREFLRESWSAAGAGETNANFISLMEIGVNEAASNIMKHAFGELATNALGVLVEVYRDKLRVILSHTGEFFEPSTIPVPVMDIPQEGGFGLFVIDEVMDNVHYGRSDNGTSWISMTRRFEETWGN